MSETKDIESVYEIIIDEVDFFMESIYEVQNSYNEAEEVLGVEELKSVLLNSNEVLNRLENMKILLKTIAFQNHRINLFTKEEQSEKLIELLLEEYDEVF